MLHLCSLNQIKTKVLYWFINTELTGNQCSTDSAWVSVTQQIDPKYELQMLIKMYKFWMCFYNWPWRVLIDVHVHPHLHTHTYPAFPLPFRGLCRCALHPWADAGAPSDFKGSPTTPASTVRPLCEAELLGVSLKHSHPC